MTTTTNLSEAISAIDTMVDSLRLSAFDITEHDAQGTVLGLHFAIADVVTYLRDIADDMGDMDDASEALNRWQFRQGLSAWEPREDYSEGEYADDYDHAEREDLYANCTLAQLIALGDLCQSAQAAVVAAGRDY